MTNSMSLITGNTGRGQIEAGLVFNVTDLLILPFTEMVKSK